MAVTPEKVRAALLAEEPDYTKAAKDLGSGALRHLSTLVGSGDSLMAAKAAYLAGVIGGPASGDVVAKAARSGEAPVRIAAAVAARRLAAGAPALSAARAARGRGRRGVLADGDSILLQLVDDSDPGVRKVALRSVPSTMSDALRERVSALRGDVADSGGAGPAPRRARKGGKKPGARRKASSAARKGARATTRGRR